MDAEMVADGDRRFAAAEFRVGRKDGTEMAGHIDLGDDFDSPILGINENRRDLVFAIGKLVGAFDFRRLAGNPAFQSVGARSGRGQIGIGF